MKRLEKNTTNSNKKKESPIEKRNEVVSTNELKTPNHKLIIIRDRLRIYSIAYTLFNQNHDVEVIERNSTVNVIDNTTNEKYHFLDMQSKEFKAASQSTTIRASIRKCLQGGRKKTLEEEKEFPQQSFSSRSRVFKKGEIFYLFDIDNCYWRTALNEGYIEEELYTKLLAPEFKLARNKALATLASIIYRTTKVNGKFKRVVQELSDYPIIYKNIRNKSYKVCFDIKEVIDKKDFLWYKTDEIAIREDSYEKVKELISKLPYSFKERKCKVLYRNLVACEDGIYMIEDGGLFNLYKEQDLEKIQRMKGKL